jgi:formate hydrogenlyase transcriptional activator
MLIQDPIGRHHTRPYEDLCLNQQTVLNRQFLDFVGNHPEIRRVLKAIEAVAPTNAKVLLYGEHGTGKDLIARFIQQLSAMVHQPMLKINCSRKLINFDRLVGTVYLDEVGDLPLDIQSELVRMIQRSEPGVRLISSTTRDLEQAVDQGRFLKALYDVLNVFAIHVPPLRERKEDIPLLVKFFVMRYGARFRNSIESVSQEVIDSLLAYSWPGNVRELENLIERAVIACKTSQLMAGDWLPKPVYLIGNNNGGLKSAMSNARGGGRSTMATSKY